MFLLQILIQIFSFGGRKINTNTKKPHKTLACRYAAFCYNNPKELVHRNFEGEAA
jgi:hypothetical protein